MSDDCEIRFSYTTTLNPGPIRGFRCKTCGKLIPWGQINDSENRPLYIEEHVLEPGGVLVMVGYCATCLGTASLINCLCLAAVNPLGRLQAGV